MRRSILAASIALAATLLPATVTAQNPSCTSLGASNLVKNCSFEAPGTGSGTWQWTNDITDWSSSSGWFERWYGHDGFAARDGKAHLELDVDTDQSVGGVRNTTIWQVLDTQAGQNYNVFFSAAHRKLGTSSDVFSQVGVLLDFTGGTSFTSAFSTPKLYNPDNYKWFDYGFSFTATGNKTTLAFRALGTPNEYGDHLDNIGVTVPEPNTFALVAAGLGALAVAARRRRSA